MPTMIGKERLIIFDTTLRDGEQSPGVTLGIDDKVAIARQLSRLGVDVCEAGFPIASEGDFAAVELIAKEVGPLTIGRSDGQPMVICGLARAKKDDIERAYHAIKHAPRHRIHTFLATSDIHLQHKLRITREQCVQQVADMVAYAKSLCADIEFSTEDAGRSDRDFLVRVIDTAIEAGATTINVPDTVGYNTPDEYGDLIKYLVTNVKGAAGVTFSTHCHNDLGLATANTIAGIMNGARQVEVTINGIGERAGNTALEEVAMAVRCRAARMPVQTTIDTTQIMRTSQLVAAYTGMRVQPNKAIVGANAFAHESGIHQDGMLKHAETYEIIRPETVGVTSSLVMGKHSGRAAFKQRLADLGYELDSDEVDKAFKRFKTVADTGKSIMDQDLHAIVQDELHQPRAIYTLRHAQIMTSTAGESTASVSLESPEGAVCTEAAVGIGPINALFMALAKAARVQVQLEDFYVKSCTGGTDALGEVMVSIRSKGGEEVFSAHGADPDIIIASAHAYTAAINKHLLSLSAPKRAHHARKVSGV